MYFNDALKALKEGKKIKLPTWLGSIRMFTQDTTGRTAGLTGWRASQSDILSDDWYEVF